MSIKNKLNRFLRKFNVEIHGLSYLQAISKSDFKNEEMQWMKDCFKHKEIIIYDVGANKGTMTKKFLSLFPNSPIHAFEPYPPYFEMLANEFKADKNIFINNEGIADKEGVFIFNVNKSIDTSSFLLSKKTGLNSDAQVKTTDQINVPVTTIKAYAAKHNHERIHILKLDIQGSELNALRGAEPLLRDKKIDVVFAETYFVEQYENQPLFFEIADYLISFGYVLQDIYHPVYGNGRLAWCDSLFVRNDLKSH